MDKTVVESLSFFLSFFSLPNFVFNYTFFYLSFLLFLIAVQHVFLYISCLFFHHLCIDFSWSVSFRFHFFFFIFLSSITLYSFFYLFFPFLFHCDRRRFFFPFMIHIIHFFLFSNFCVFFFSSQSFSLCHRRKQLLTPQRQTIESGSFATCWHRDLTRLIPVTNMFSKRGKNRSASNFTESVTCTNTRTHG